MVNPENIVLVRLIFFDMSGCNARNKRHSNAGLVVINLLPSVKNEMRGNIVDVRTSVKRESIHLTQNIIRIYMDRWLIIIVGDEKKVFLLLLLSSHTVNFRSQLECVRNFWKQSKAKQKDRNERKKERIVKVIFKSPLEVSVNIKNCGQSH